MDESHSLKVKVRMKGFDGEIEYEVPRIFIQYNTDGKKLDEVTKEAVKLYKALSPPQAQEEYNGMDTGNEGCCDARRR